MSNEIGISADAQLSNDFATIADVPIQPDSTRITPQQIASGMSRGIQQLGSDKVYSDGGNQQIIVEDTADPRVLMGNQTTFGEGFYVSKAGIDAKTNTDPAQWIFNSNQNVFKIVQSETATIPTSGTNTATVSIAHGLSYIPAFIAYVFVLSNYNTVPLVNINSVTGAIISIYSGWSDATNINFQVVVPGGTVGSTTPVKYYLLQETAV